MIRRMNEYIAIFKLKALIILKCLYIFMDEKTNERFITYQIADK